MSNAHVRKSIYTVEHRKLAHLLRAMRLRRGISQDELASQLGKSQSFVAKYESGDRRLDLVELDEICVALGSSLRALVSRYKA